MVFIKEEKRTRNAEAPGALSIPTHISATAHAAKPIYEIRLQARSGADGIRTLRAALKVLWRRYQLRCLSAREVKDGRDPRNEGGGL